MNEETQINQNQIKPIEQTSKNPIFWIPFGIAAILLVIIGLFRFSQSADNVYFIYICLIAFAVAALPWISSFRVKGLFEIERAIEHTKEDTRDRIEQTNKRFDDKLFSLRTELISNLNSIQSQVSQQANILNSTQSQVSQQSTIQAMRQSSSQIIAIGDAIKSMDTMENISGGDHLANEKSLLKVDPKYEDKSSLSSPEFLELRAGFAQSAAAALDDPLGLKCGKLLRQIPATGQSLTYFIELQHSNEITEEQFQTLKNLKLIEINSPEGSITEVVTITNLGKIYGDYWRLSGTLADLADTAQIAALLGPLVIPTLASLWVTLKSKFSQ